MVDTYDQNEWEHRGLQCRLYRRDTPDSYRWDGYVCIGDEWVHAIEADDGIDRTIAVDRVESAADMMIMRAVSDGADDNDQFDQPDQFPDTVDPDPCPQPVPYDPKPYRWRGDDEPIMISDCATELSWSSSTSSSSGGLGRADSQRESSLTW